MHDDPAIRCRNCSVWKRCDPLQPPQHAVFGNCGLPGVDPALQLRSEHDACGRFSSRHGPVSITAQTQVWDTPSGMGGTFTVTLLDDEPGRDVLTARVCYGRLREDGSYERWLDWDGYTFPVKRSELSNPRLLGDPPRRRYG